MSFVSKEDLTAIFTNLNTKLRKKPTAVRLTQAEYDQLTSEEVHDTTKTYYITDGQGGGGYTLPVASASTLGGIKVGSGLSIDNAGVLSSASGGAPQFKAIELESDYFTCSVTAGSGYFANQKIKSILDFETIKNNYYAIVLHVSADSSSSSTSPVYNMIDKVLYIDTCEPQISYETMEIYYLWDSYYSQYWSSQAPNSSGGMAIFPYYTYRLYCRGLINFPTASDNKLELTFNYMPLDYDTVSYNNDNSKLLPYLQTKSSTKYFFVKVYGVPR